MQYEPAELSPAPSSFAHDQVRHAMTSVKWLSCRTGRYRRGRREQASHVGRHLAGELPSEQRCGNETGGVKFVHEPLHREAVAELAPALGQEHLDLHLADEIARAVGRLLKIQMLLRPNGVRVEPEPAARRVR